MTAGPQCPSKKKDQVIDTLIGRLFAEPQHNETHQVPCQQEGEPTTAHS